MFALLNTYNMKARHLFLLPLCCLLASCGEDRRDEYTERTEANMWIEEVMREHYYWYENIPETGSLNYYATPDHFFPTLLYSKDGTSSNRYSTIKAQEEPDGQNEESLSYGFKFELHTIGGNSSVYYARIQYVLDGSPAADANLVRGNWIMKVDGIPINKYNFTGLYDGGAAELTIGKYSPKDEENPEVITQTHTVNIAGARAVADNPVFLQATYATAAGMAGYLVYNHFGAGIQEGDYSYDNKLRKAFADFKTAGVSELVLDLRYNTGEGTVEVSRLMGSMLVPAEALGKVMNRVVYNDLNSGKNYETYFAADLIQGGSNLNLSRIFILTSANTASVAEMLISAIQPYMTVVLAGNTTKGKNVGTQTFTDSEKRYPWQLTPVVYEVYNSAKATFSAGFTPATDYRYNESTDKTVFLPLGDIGEPLLKMALLTLEGTYPPTEEEEEGE